MIWQLEVGVTRFLSQIYTWKSLFWVIPMIFRNCIWKSAFFMKQNYPLQSNQCWLQHVLMFSLDSADFSVVGCFPSIWIPIREQHREKHSSISLLLWRVEPFCSLQVLCMEKLESLGQPVEFVHLVQFAWNLEILYSPHLLHCNCGVILVEIKASPSSLKIPHME